MRFVDDSIRTTGQGACRPRRRPTHDAQATRVCPVPDVAVDDSRAKSSSSVTGTLDGDTP